MIPTIAAIIVEAARSYGSKTALVIGRDELTFHDIFERSLCFAGGLRDRGLNKGDRVVIYMPNSWEWMVAYYGAALAGAVIVPANILLNSQEVAFLTADSGAAAVVVAADRHAAVQSALSAHDVHNVKFVVLGIAKESPSDFDFSRVMASEMAPIELGDPDAVASISYTSGTTGKPKGAMLTNRGIFMSTALTATTHVRTRSDTCISALPLPHVYGNVIMHATFLTGMKLVLFSQFDAGEALGAIQQHQATIFDGVPTMYYYMLSHPDFERYRLESLQRCTVGGQTMPVAKLNAVEAAFGCRLLELWGMTELGGPATTHSPYVPGRPGSAGTAFPFMEARIVDVEDPSRELPTGSPGELLVRGPLVMKGYFNNEQATRETIVDGGWLRTGDIAYLDPDGYVFIVDRQKDMIITGGYNIYPAELEAVIATHPAVAMVAVGSVPDETKGELAKAYIVLKPDHVVIDQDIFDHCRKHLGSYKIPRRLSFVHDLPKTSTGKIMRRALIDLEQITN